MRDLMKDLTQVKLVLRGEKVSAETIKSMKECNKKWEKQREMAGLNSLTQKDRISQIEINIATITKCTKDANKDIKTIYILFAFQILIDTLILLALFKVK